MNQFLEIDGAELWHIGGWTMVHFLWIGALAGVVAAAMRLVLWRAGPHVRYVAALGSLVLLAALPVAIAAWLMQRYPIDEVERPVVATRQLEIETMDAASAEGNSIAQLALEPLSLPQLPPRDVDEIFVAHDSAAEAEANHRPSPGLTGDSDLIPYFTSPAWLESSVPLLPWLWLAGTPITLALLATGIVGTERLRRSSRPVNAGAIAELAAHLAVSLRVGRRVTIAVCDRVAAPVLVGILRPMILLPPAALTGWSPDEIEMVLLHELAHVRRWDNLLNLFQRLIESLLFFHPAVWLVSRWVRSEREACCDAFVVRRTNRPHAYAQLLVALTAQMPRSVLFQPAATSALTAKPLRKRIRNILQLEDDPMLISGESFVVVLAGLVTAATLAALYLPTRSQAEESAIKVSESTDETATDADVQATSEPVNTAANMEPARRVEVEQVRVGDENVTVVRGPQDDVNAFIKQVEARESREGETNGPIFVVHNVPQEMMRDVETWAKLMNVRRHLSDKPGRFLMQAPADVHDRLHALLDATPQWNDLTAAAERERDPVATLEQDGGRRVEWRTMGLTLGPPREVQRKSMRPRSVIGLEVIAVEPGSPAAWLTIEPNDTLTGISNFDTTSLSQLESMIKTLLDGSTRVRHTIEIVRSDGVQFTTYLPQATRETVPREPLQVQLNDSEPASKERELFPSLEDLKLADLAWERLGLELQPIGEADLKRVRALGYDGGLKVIGGQGDMMNRDIQIVGGDILVGLHAWPTTTFKDVAEILQRDDLEELNPLRFYVVRRVPGGGYGAYGGGRGGYGEGEIYGRGGDEARDELVIGRIRVRTEQYALPKTVPVPTESHPYQPGKPAEPAKPTPAPDKGTDSTAPTQRLAESIRIEQYPVFLLLFKSPTDPNEQYQHLTELQRKYNNLGIAIAIVGNQEDAARNKIERLPVYVLFRNGVEVKRFVGKQSIDVLQQAIEEIASAEPAGRPVREPRQDTQAPALPSAVKEAEPPKASTVPAGAPATFEAQPLLPREKRVDMGVTVTAESQEALDNFHRIASTPRPSESIGVLRKMVEREQKKLERMDELAKNNSVSAAELAAQRADYEISVERLHQAERALEYYKLLIDYAEAEYQAALEVNKKAPHAVTEHELRRLKLKVDLAEAQLKAMSE